GGVSNTRTGERNGGVDGCVQRRSCQLWNHHLGSAQSLSTFRARPVRLAARVRPRPGKEREGRLLELTFANRRVFDTTVQNLARISLVTAWCVLGNAILCT